MSKTFFWTDVSEFFCFSPFPETSLSFSTLFCRTVNVSTSRWAFRLRDFPQDLLAIDDLHVRGRLIGAEPVGTDRGLLAVGYHRLYIFFYYGFLKLIFDRTFWLFRVSRKSDHPVTTANVTELNKILYLRSDIYFKQYCVVS